MERSEALALAGLGTAVVVAVVVVIRANRPPEPIKVTTSVAAAQISVHVVGEVVWPGLYVLKAGARVQDAIFAAHGPSYIADLRGVNLAAPLRDGDRVVIPRIIQPTFPLVVEKMRPGTSARPPTPPPPAVVGTPVAGEPLGAVNVNIATAEDLERLPGIGPVLAHRIVEFREARGLFRRLEDLLEVKGIGAKLFHRIRPLVRLE
ncbi:MAG: helix-hairpin-helix domain-containing protein [Armatimonadota bacterium]